MTNLEEVRNLIKRAVMNDAEDEKFSVAEFSRDSVDRLVTAMGEARKKAKIDALDA